MEKNVHYWVHKDKAVPPCCLYLTKKFWGSHIFEMCSLTSWYVNIFRSHAGGIDQLNFQQNINQQYRFKSVNWYFDSTNYVYTYGSFYPCSEHGEIFNAQHLRTNQPNKKMIYRLIENNSPNPKKIQNLLFLK